MRIAIAILSLFLGACAAGEEAVDFELVPNAEINSPAQVLSRVRHIVMLVDATHGELYPPGPVEVVGNVQIKDADGDTRDRELVALIDVEADHLPKIRLVRGTLPTDLIDVRFLGGAMDVGDPRVALGEARGVQLGLDVPLRQVEFDLVPELLPPRVSETSPVADGSIGPCRLDHLYITFSEPVLESTLASAISLDPGTIDSINVVGQTVDLAISGVFGPGPHLSFDLRVDSSVLDYQGEALDQLATVDGDQPFEQRFDLTCTPSAP